MVYRDVYIWPVYSGNCANDSMTLHVIRSMVDVFTALLGQSHNSILTRKHSYQSITILILLLEARLFGLFYSATILSKLAAVREEGNINTLKDLAESDIMIYTRGGTKSESGLAGLGLNPTLAGFGFGFESGCRTCKSDSENEKL